MIGLQTIVVFRWTHRDTVGLQLTRESNAARTSIGNGGYTFEIIVMHISTGNYRIYRKFVSLHFSTANMVTPWFCRVTLLSFNVVRCTVLTLLTGMRRKTPCTRSPGGINTHCTVQVWFSLRSVVMESTPIACKRILVWKLTILVHTTRQWTSTNEKNIYVYTYIHKVNRACTRFIVRIIVRNLNDYFLTVETLCTVLCSFFSFPSPFPNAFYET